MAALGLVLLHPSPLAARPGEVVPGNTLIRNGDDPTSCQPPEGPGLCENTVEQKRCHTAADCSGGGECQILADTCGLRSDGQPRRPGDIDLVINFGMPPLPSAPPTPTASGRTGHIEYLNDQLKRANRVFCDSTEGYLRIANVRYSYGEYGRESADIYWDAYFTDADGKHAFRSTSSSSINIYGEDVLSPGAKMWSSQATGFVIAHEMAHRYLGIRDEYPDERYGWGPAFDGPATLFNTGSQAPQSRGLGGYDLSLRQSVKDPLDTNAFVQSSLLQMPQVQVCVNGAGDAPYDVDPLRYQDASCRRDSDCSGLFQFCGDPRMGTELSTTQALRREAWIGQNRTDGVCPTQAWAAQELVVQGYVPVKQGTASSCGYDADLDGQNHDVGEDCDGPPLACGGLIVNGYTFTGSGTAPCSLCVRDVSACSPSSTPQCSPGTSIPCESLGLAPGKTASCSNGIWLRSACNGPAVNDSRVPTTINVNFVSQESLSMPLHTVFTGRQDTAVRDASLDSTKANHNLIINLVPQLAGFSLQIGVNEADYLGGTPDAYHRLAVWDGTWDPVTHQVASINGHPYLRSDSESWPHLRLGSDTDISSYMHPEGMDRYAATPTGKFKNGADALDLVLHAENLVQGTFTGEAGYTDMGRYLAYARNGVLQLPGTDRDGQDIPTRGPITLNPQNCSLAYNPATERTELSAASLHQYILALKNAPPGSVLIPNDTDLADWSAATDYLQGTFGLNIKAFNQNPNEKLPATFCPDPILPAPVTRIDPGEIVIALDRSGSMSEELGSSTRLDFARAALRTLAKFYSDNVADRSELKLGVVWYNHNADVMEPPPPDPTRTPSTTGLRKLVNVVNPSTWPTNSTTPGSVSLADINSSVRYLSDPLGESPQPKGNTAIGVALNTAYSLLGKDVYGVSAVTPGIKTLRSIILLTDGEETVHRNDGSAEDPKVAADKIRQDGITEVYTVNIGQTTSFGANVQSQLVADTRGEEFSALDASETPATFFDLGVKQIGQSLALHHLSPPVAEPFGDGPLLHYPIQVEANVPKLQILVSAKHLVSGAVSSSFDVVDPSGTSRSGDFSPDPTADFSYEQDQYYYLLTVKNPAAGTWQLSTFFNNVYVSGFVDNSSHTCSVYTDKRIFGAGDKVRIRGVARDRAIVGQGVQMDVRVRRPDYSEFVIPMLQDPGTGELEGDFPEAEYRGHGLYQLIAHCAVLTGATLHPGELAPAHEELAPAQPFVREASASFLLRTGGVPPLPTSYPHDTDADGDGIPNTQEPALDTDTDGVPAVYDPDDDGDDVPDGVDVDPTNPNLPTVTHVVAKAGPDQILECSSNGTALASFNASASTGTGGSLSYKWTASVALNNANTAQASGLFPVGTTSATLTAKDGVRSDNDSLLVTVLDTQGPVLTPPSDVTAQTCGAVNIGTATAVDACGGAVQITSNRPTTFRSGLTVVTWLAVDRFGNQSQKTQRVFVGPGESTSCCPAGANVIVGTSNNDTLTGTSGVDCIFGKGGQDLIRGLGSNDVLSGGDGDDTVEGGDGDDTVQGGTGQDTLRGQNGVDTLLGGDGDDRCWGGSQDDVIYGGIGQDNLQGEDGNDTLFGEVGNDTLNGGNGNDALIGGTETDSCTGGPGSNTFATCEVTQ